MREIYNYKNTVISEQKVLSCRYNNRDQVDELPTLAPYQEEPALYAAKLRGVYAAKLQASELWITCFTSG